MFAIKKLDKPVVLFCPLNWGLGHASRIVPLVNHCIDHNFGVVVAASGDALVFLQHELGARVEYLEFPGVKITYSSGRFLLPKLLAQVPSFLFSIYKEYQWMKKTVSVLSPSVIISDNRYGARSSKVHSVIITHQLQIQFRVRWLKNLVNKVNHFLLNRFHECWVPDFSEEPGLAGALSHNKIKIPVHYLGPLSRFNRKQVYSGDRFAESLPKEFILVLLSGPEPQRTLLEDLLKKQLEGQTVVWFRGIPPHVNLSMVGNHYWFNHGSIPLMGYCIEKAEVVICRSGYSTLMDLAVFGPKAVVIPTPGQTEQEYLGKLLEINNAAINLSQHRIDQLSDSIEKAKMTKGIPCLDNTTLAGLSELLGGITRKA